MIWKLKFKKMSDLLSKFADGKRPSVLKGPFSKFQIASKLNKFIVATIPFAVVYFLVGWIWRWLGILILFTVRILDQQQNLQQQFLRRVYNNNRPTSLNQSLPQSWWTKVPSLSMLPLSLLNGTMSGRVSHLSGFRVPTEKSWALIKLPKLISWRNWNGSLRTDKPSSRSKLSKQQCGNFGELHNIIDGYLFAVITLEINLFNELYNKNCVSIQEWETVQKPSPLWKFK